MSVTAIGTAFNVRLDPQSVAVLVTEGTVALSPPARVEVKPETPANTAAPPPAAGEVVLDGQSMLHAGERATIPTSEVWAGTVKVESVGPDEMEGALSWRSRLLEFDTTPLAEVVAEFNRFNHHQLVIADPELAARPFGGSFRADNRESFVGLLEARFDVVATRTGDRTILRRAAISDPAR